MPEDFVENLTEAKIDNNPIIETDVIAEVYTPAVNAFRSITGKPHESIEHLLRETENPTVPLDDPEWERLMNHFHFEDGDINKPKLELIPENVLQQMEELLHLVEMSLSEHRRKQGDQFNLIESLSTNSQDSGHKEKLRRQLIREMSYRYLAAKELNAPVVYSWMDIVLGEMKENPDSKIAFMYRDGHLPEVFANYIRSKKYPDITQDRFCVVNISRINAYADGFTRPYHDLLGKYMTQQLGQTKAVYLVDTGISGSLVSAFTDLMPQTAIYPRFLELNKTFYPLELNGGNSRSQIEHDVESTYGFPDFEETLMPTDDPNNPLSFCSRSYTFKEIDGVVKPVSNKMSIGSSGSNNGLVEILYVLASKHGYLDWLNELEENTRKAPSSRVSTQSLREFSSKLKGQEPGTGLQILRPLLPLSVLTPETDDSDAWIRLVQEKRRLTKPERINFNKDLF